LFVQTINILIVIQSVIDLCASFFTLIVALVEVDGTRMSRASIYHQFVCRIWITRIPVWVFVNTSTYGILIIALERYIAVIYPMWYNVRMNCWECLLYLGRHSFTYRLVAKLGCSLGPSIYHLSDTPRDV